MGAAKKYVVIALVALGAIWATNKIPMVSKLVGKA